jgi:2-polyprenyl-6-methoxyphenol hydroxylase-like FAD-dependent oxidoreductase
VQGDCAVRAFDDLAQGDDMRILIIGAGTGGLCLAHGLRQAGIDVEVFERSSGSTDGLPGYGIHLNANGCRALHDCLPAGNWERFDTVAAPAKDIVRFHDEHLRQIVARDGDFASSESDPIMHRRAVSRLALREVLLDGLTDPDKPVVRWDKKFVRYEQSARGITAHFADGTTATGDILIGADGSNSRVRQQYLPHLQRLDVGVLNVAGRYALTPERAAGLPAGLTEGSVNNVVPAGPGWLFVSTWHAPRVRAAAQQGGSRIPDDAAGDFVVWAYAGAADSYPADVENLSSGQLRDLVLDRTAGWAPTLRSLITDAEPGSVQAVRLLSMPALDPWPSSTVTLLGDAIHNMTPMAGVGANTALRDAGHLRAALVQAADGSLDAVQAIAGYEARMRKYANIAVSQSRRNARTAGSESRLGRTAFRGLLRVAEVVPPVKRLMFAGPKDSD